MCVGGGGGGGDSIYVCKYVCMYECVRSGQVRVFNVHIQSKLL